MDNLIPSPYPSQFNTIRVVFFMETSPNSGKFQQIVLSPENVRKTLDHLESCMEHRDGAFRVVCNDKQTITLPDIKDSYAEEEIKLLSKEEENESN